MDTKALARSKRSHSQHHSKRPHPNQTAKAPSDGAAGGKNPNKPSGNQIREQPRRSRGSSALPSNWDRYDEEYSSDSEKLSRDGMSQHLDVIKPKSKGADYRHLISEAQSQSQSQSQSHLDPYMDSFAFLHDFLPDFNWGCSILSARGESILSRMEDDNFVAEDKATASPETPFLSLNLNTLERQLVKADLSKRLFIEADLLPPEQCAEEPKAGGNQNNQMPKTFQSEATTRISDKEGSSGFSEKDKITKSNCEVKSSHNTGSSGPVPTFIDQGSGTGNQVKGHVMQFGRLGQNRAPEFAAPTSKGSMAFPNKTLPAIKAATPEEELDMLLDSFSENTFPDCHVSKEKSSNMNPSFQDSRSSNMNPSFQDSSTVALQQRTRTGQDSSKTRSVIANFDDEVDKLLEQTSNLTYQNGTSRPQNMNTLSRDIPIDDILGETPNLMNKNSTFQAKAPMAPPFADSIDDIFEKPSNLMNQKGALQPKDVKPFSLDDDSIDDLLNEISNLTSQNDASQTQKMNADFPEITSSTSASSQPKSQVPNDFDAWFATL